MPFVRLITIYIAVFLVAVVFFNRDGVMAMFSSTPDAASLPPIPMASSPAPTPEPAPTPSVAVDPPAVETPAPAITTPVAEPSQPETTTALVQPVTEQQAEPVADIGQRLDEARSAYAKGDMAKAETLYLAMAEEFATEVDVHGELGNLYFLQQRYDEAGGYFHTAGKLLIEVGRINQAMPLIGVLQGIAPEKAADLRAMISQ